MVSVQKFIALRNAAVAVQDFLVTGCRCLFQFCQFLTQRQDFGIGLQHKVPYRLTANASKALLHIPYINTRFEADSPPVGIVRPQQTFYQRRFSAAINSHQPDFFSFGDHKADVFEYFLHAKGLLQFIND